jgi:hypothetical protein
MRESGYLVLGDFGTCAVAQTALLLSRENEGAPMRV